MAKTKKAFTIKEKNDIVRKMLKYNIPNSSAPILFDITPATASRWIRDYLAVHPEDKKLGAVSSNTIQRNQDEQLCWTCANAVPNADGTKGCSWSRSLVPVPGCTYTKGKKGEEYIETCPKYVFG